MDITALPFVPGLMLWIAFMFIGMLGGAIGGRWVYRWALRARGEKHE